MTTPGIILGLILSIFYGAAFHLWRGGGISRLLLYLLLSVCGFWIGQFVGSRYHLGFGQLGTLQLGSATIGAFLMLGLGYWLSLVRVTPG